MRGKRILVLIISLILIINISFIVISINPNILGNVISEEGDFEPGFVSKIIDGDTVIIGGVSTRLLGIDTDERGYPCYSEAKKRIEELVLNQEVMLEKDGDKIDQYKRNLRYIFLDNKNINLQLVEEGLAVARFSPENKKYKEEILNAEILARENKIGCKWRDEVVEGLEEEKEEKEKKEEIEEEEEEIKEEVEELNKDCLKLGCSKETQYVGSKNSDKYHKLDCRWVEKISKENLIYFESEGDAKKKNYIGCKTCIG